MAGLSGRNTRIAPSRLGAPRFPFERADAGDGYAASGPCLVRKMTPEEMARYGPPVAPKDRDLSRGEAAFVVDNAASLEHAARIARVSVAKMKNEIARHCVAVLEGWKEDETMSPAIQMTEQEAREKLPPTIPEKPSAPDSTVQDPPAFYESTSGRRFTAERIARAEEALSREEYIRLKSEGISDSKIIKDLPGFCTDLLITLKKKWGVNIILPGGRKKEKEQPRRTEEPKEETPVQAISAGLTITQALQLRVELTEDIDSLDKILDVAERGAELTGRVVQMLTWYRDSYRQRLERIEEAFSRTVIQL